MFALRSSNGQLKFYCFGLRCDCCLANDVPSNSQERRCRRRRREGFRASRRGTATINLAALKQKAADYCIDEFNDRASAFIVAQSFIWLISRPLFRAPFAGPTANNYNSSLINIREWDCSFALCTPPPSLSLYTFFSLFFFRSAIIPFPFLPSVRPLAVFIAIIETHGIHPSLPFFPWFPPMGGVPLPGWQGCQPSNPPPTLKIWPCASHPSRGRARKARVV